jgi:uncharacterized phage-associated protein
MASALTVAHRILELADEAGATITPMQLLKLVYISHGWMLGLYGKPLIDDEIQAWKYGPVIPKLYNAVRQFRDAPVVGRLSSSADQFLTKDQEAVVSETFEGYGHLNGPCLG